MNGPWSLICIIAVYFCLIPGLVTLSRDNFDQVLTSNNDVSYNKFLLENDEFPVLELPYAKYRASRYSEGSDVYVFTNIRYAAPPTGSLRWKRPLSPLNELFKGIQDGKTGWKCHQAEIPRRIPPYDNSTESSEDCLFLNIFVPGSVFRKEKDDNKLPLPVDVWIHGGGFVSGSGYEADGEVLMMASENQLIFVSANYRLGAFGWLAGSDFLNEGFDANLGLWDQRAVLEWCKDYISLVNGDPTAITVHGISAGASSILHHLTSDWSDLLFSRAIMESPAFSPQFNYYQADGVFEEFAKRCECFNAKDQVGCLLGMPESVLVRANSEQVASGGIGHYSFGPFVDGKLIKALPWDRLVLELSRKDVPIIVSNVADEGEIFVEPIILTEEDIIQTIVGYFPWISDSAISMLLKLYPLKDRFRLEGQRDRARSMVSDVAVTCNVRALVESYGSPCYVARFVIPPSYHGIDYFLTFHKPVRKLFGRPLVETQGRRYWARLPYTEQLAIGWQSYLVSMILTGDPNKLRNQEMTVGMIKAKNLADGMSATQIGPAYIVSKVNPDATSEHCQFWWSSTWH